MWLNDTQKIGVGLVVFGLFFMTMGVVLLLDVGLMAVGNLLFLSGTTTLLGPQRMVLYITRRDKSLGSISLVGGILLVLMKYPFIGFLCEIYGCVRLFSDFFPMIFGFLRQVPLIGPFLSLLGY
ncbi:hypothetical protein BDF14DRAFT_1875457 [Spinellus fusiger]|nr:hypothetical protein BDF14DRAFT_1875457 [Spinellus fusiger]